MSSFPFLTLADPAGTSEGSLDPLGLYQIADTLATQLVPSVRERMIRVRFLTAMAVGALVTEGFEADPRQRDSLPYLAWEWHVVEAIARSAEAAEARGGLSGVPGISVTRRAHLKVAATVDRGADLWERGEKVVVFAFYRHTCSALRFHIGEKIRRRLLARARERMGLPDADQGLIWERLEQIQQAFFGRIDAPRPGQRALDAALGEIIARHTDAIDRVDPDRTLRDLLLLVMRRFLRARSALVRCFPLERSHDADPHDLVREFLDHEDGSGMSWRTKFDAFIAFLCERCAKEERHLLLDDLSRVDTGDHSAAEDQHDTDDDTEGRSIANVGLCSGATKKEIRVRRMRAFNSPLFPDVLVCSEVMGEGVDLHRFCRHVIHHDLAWNPSDIEQRTGRIDRLGCKAEGRHPIVAYLPYLGGAADERQFKVMRDREQWFQVVMGQQAVEQLITAESAERSHALPRAVTEILAFDLSIASDSPAAPTPSECATNESPGGGSPTPLEEDAR